jgi:hypothetical protein
MASSLTATTELEAVNIMLSVLGQAPVASLDGNLSADAETAQSILKEVSKDIQSQGWHFNTEYEYEFTPDGGTNEITVPSDIVRVTLADPESYITQRGSKLYNIEDQTFEFTETVKATIVRFLDFTDLPEGARRFIILRASRILSDRMVTDGEAHQFAREDEYLAHAALNREEGLRRHYDMGNSPMLQRLNRFRSRRF